MTDALKALDTLEQAASAGTEEEVLWVKYAQCAATIRAAHTAPAQPVPTAWFRGICTPSSPNGPAEYDVDMQWGDDCPQGDGWKPLYSDLRLPPPGPWRAVADGLYAVVMKYPWLSKECTDALAAYVAAKEAGR